MEHPCSRRAANLERRGLTYLFNADRPPERGQPCHRAHSATPSRVKLDHTPFGKRPALVVDLAVFAGSTPEVGAKDEPLHHLACHVHGDVLAEAAVHAVTEVEPAVIRTARLKLVRQGKQPRDQGCQCRSKDRALRPKFSEEVKRIAVDPAADEVGFVSIRGRVIGLQEGHGFVLSSRSKEDRKLDGTL
jgi:hypothetical protein